MTVFWSIWLAKTACLGRVNCCSSFYTCCIFRMLNLDVSTQWQDITFKEGGSVNGSLILDPQTSRNKLAHCATLPIHCVKNIFEVQILLQDVSKIRGTSKAFQELKRYPGITSNLNPCVSDFHTCLQFGSSGLL